MLELDPQRAAEVLFRLGAALLAVLPLSFSYRLTHREVGYEWGMARNLVLLAVTVCAIMLGIMHNLALSLGLVGALSIIRFRTAVKNSGDLLYFLVAIAIGLIASTGDLTLLLSATASTLLVIVGSFLVRGSGPGPERYTLIFSYAGDGPACAQLIQTLGEKFRAVKLCSKTPSGEAGSSQLCVQVRAPIKQLLEDLERVQQQHAGISGLQVHDAQEIVEV